MTLLAVVETTAKHWWMPERFDAIYGAAIGGAIALLTSIFSNRNARKRQTIDLKAQSEERDKERHYSLKREVYLPLIEASSGAISFVMQLPTVALEQLRTQEPLMHFARQAARLGLIAPSSVQIPVQKAQKQLMQTAMMLMNERWAIENVATEISTNNLGVQLRLNRQKELQLRQEKHIDSKTGDENIMKHLSDEHQKATAEINSLLASNDSLNRKKAQLEIALQRRAAAALLPISDHSCEALIAIRNELGMPADEEWIRKFSQSTANEAAATIKDFQDEFEKRILAATT
jgi:hypothetical protein